MESLDFLNVQFALQIKQGHFVFYNNNYHTENLEGIIFAIRFDKLENPTYPSFLSLNNEVEYPIYNSDGATFLSLSDLYNSVILLTLNNKKWQLVKTIFRSNENVGHVLTDTKGKLLPNRQVIKLSYFNIKDLPGEGAIELINPVWALDSIQGISGVMNSSEWVNLYNDELLAPISGLYKITVNLKLNNIGAPAREVGVKVNNQEDWVLQYKRLRHSFLIITNLEKGDSLIPSIYVDKMSTSDTINIEDCSFCVECLNTQEL